VFQQSEKDFGFGQRSAQLDGGKVHLGGGGDFVSLHRGEKVCSYDFKARLGGGDFVSHILHASSIAQGVGHLPSYLLNSLNLSVTVSACRTLVAPHLRFAIRLACAKLNALMYSVAVVSKPDWDAVEVGILASKSVSVIL